MKNEHGGDVELGLEIGEVLLLRPVGVGDEAVCYRCVR